MALILDFVSVYIADKEVISQLCERLENVLSVSQRDSADLPNVVNIYTTSLNIPQEQLKVGLSVIFSFFLEV